MPHRRFLPWFWISFCMSIKIFENISNNLCFSWFQNSLKNFQDFQCKYYNQPQKLLILTIFSRKSPNICLTCSNIPRISPVPSFNVVPSLEKLCQVVAAKNDQANLQPTLNKGAGGSSLTIFVTHCLQN